MIAILISSAGSRWTFYAHAGDKVFLVEDTPPPDDRAEEAMAYMLREARWMFGDFRLIVINRNGAWVEVLHDGTGRVIGMIPYDGPVPTRQEEDIDG
jgi:biotin carboxylase